MVSTIELEVVGGKPHLKPVREFFLGVRVGRRRGRWRWGTGNGGGGGGVGCMTNGEGKSHALKMKRK